MKWFGGVTCIACCLSLAALSASAQTGSDSLLREFKDPPTSARPRVWWHWMNGNVTQAGIRLDLDWMRRVGIGGVQNFDAALDVPQVVDRRLPYMTPEWQDAFRYAADQAEQNGLEMAIASSPGWSETGGPWVKPEQGMKKLVWSQRDVEGGRKFWGMLAKPPGVAGPYQDAPLEASIEGPPRPVADFYRDVAVIAYRLPAASAAIAHAEVTVGGHRIDGALLTDGSLKQGIEIVPGDESSACIDYVYPAATRVASVRLALPVGSDFFRAPLALPVLEGSDDGIHFKKIVDVPAGSFIQHTVSFPAVLARRFRVCFHKPPPVFMDVLFDAAAPGVNMGAGLGSGAPPAANPAVEVLELQLLPYAQVTRAEEKAGFAFVPNYYDIETLPVEPSDVTPRTAVVDLSAMMRADGSIDWKVPRGRWRLVRFGYSLTGKENHPATEEATGLEVDKLDRPRVKSYMDAYLSRYEKVLGPSHLGHRGVRAMVVDSIEAGAENWTESLPAEFARRRGYELMPWMPVLTGAVVGSAADSDRFLYDFRRTLSELISDAHYAQIAESAHGRGLTLYGEALELGRPVLGDDMEMRRHTDIPMAALWSFRPQNDARPVRYADIRGAASVAHIYGQNLVAAESMTSAFAPWAFAPRDLRPIIDLEFALGVNRPVVHTSVHQPLIGKAPGLRLSIFGQDFNRNESWAEQAAPWVSYLSRTAYLLQQGRYVADVLFFYGEESPLTALYGDQLPDFPRGYAFDFANPDVLNRVSVRDGSLVTESGMRYRVLYLGGTSTRMTLPVLKRIVQLVADGATVVGAKPTGSPSLSDDPAEFDRAANSLFSQANAAAGRVTSPSNLLAALGGLALTPDFETEPPGGGSHIMFLHRHLEGGDIYFLSNRHDSEERVDGLFRTSGYAPEIWRADTGMTEPVSYRMDGARTHVSLHLMPYESVFVVFRRASGTREARFDEPTPTRGANLDADWTVRFEGLGAPAGSRATRLGSWTEDADSAVRYFSGTAVYSRTFTQAKGRANSRMLLDLGEVREIAAVKLNGQEIGTLWHPPYRLDITDALRAGRNELEVRVTNLWVNRLIGDAQPGVAPLTFTVSPPYRPDAPLRASGLMGPVTLLNQADIALTRAH